MVNPMTKKTWIKVKRGLVIDSKHRLALATNIWLYLYMLDVADWDTGKIVDWHDKAAADELEIPLSTIRFQRRKLEDSLYISTLQLHNRQEITIKNWVNPREYSGKVYNQSDNGLSLSGEDEIEGDNEGNNEGSNGLSLLHITHIPHTTLKEVQPPEPFGDDPEPTPEPIKEKRTSNYKPLLGAIASVCRMDLKVKTQAGQVGKAAKELDVAGYTPDQVYDFLDWWKKFDWRWTKEHRVPAPHEVLTNISKTVEEKKPEVTDEYLRSIGYK